jgi:hypothetical protein
MWFPFLLTTILFLFLWRWAAGRLARQRKVADHDVAEARAIAQQAQTDAATERQRATALIATVAMTTQSADTARKQMEELRSSNQRTVSDLQAQIDSLRSSQAAERKTWEDVADTTSSAAAAAEAGWREQVRALQADIEALRTLTGSAALPPGAEAGLIEVGIYRPVFRFPDSKRYVAAITENTSRQRAMVADDQAVIATKTWAIGGDVKAGAKMSKSLVKLALRAFNGDADAAVSRVSWNNLEAMVLRLEKTQSVINTILEPYSIQVTDAYRELRCEELRLTQEEADIRHREREEQKAIREQMRDEEKARREAEKAKEDAEREERRAAAALAAARAELQRTHAMDSEQNRARIAELEARLAAAQSGKAAALSMAQFTKLGHVYIISNIGSMGQGLVKIGMTRRLDPIDRVDELSDASVPFPFDVHALIRTEDAPALESALHERFAERRVNLINDRKEFFQVGLDDIDVACKELGVDVRFTIAAEAAEYRQSSAMRMHGSDGGPRVATIAKDGHIFTASTHLPQWRATTGGTPTPPPGEWRPYMQDPLLDLVDQARAAGWRVQHITPITQTAGVERTEQAVKVDQV